MNIELFRNFGLELNEGMPYLTNIFHFVLGFIASYDRNLLIIITLVYTAYQSWEYLFYHDNIVLDMFIYFLGVLTGMLKYHMKQRED
jgi:hypothetical protein